MPPAGRLQFLEPQPNACLFFFPTEETVVANSYVQEATFDEVVVYIQEIMSCLYNFKGLGNTAQPHCSFYSHSGGGRRHL